MSRFLTDGRFSSDLKTFLLVCLIAPVAEEFFFRALLITFGRQRFGDLAALLFSSILFAILHWNVTAIIPALIGGFLFGLLFLRGNSIIFPILAHIFANLASFLPSYVLSSFLITFSGAYLIWLNYHLIRDVFFNKSKSA